MVFISFSFFFSSREEPKTKTIIYMFADVKDCFSFCLSICLSMLIRNTMNMVCQCGRLAGQAKVYRYNFNPSMLGDTLKQWEVIGNICRSVNPVTVLQCVQKVNWMIYDHHNF